MTSDKTSGEERGEVSIAPDENAGSVGADDPQENSIEVSASDDSPDSDSEADQDQPEIDAQQPDQSASRPAISIESQKDRIRQVINDTQLLISHASIAGKEVPKNHIEIIANAERNFQTAEFDASKEAEFWSAVANITKDVSPITVESIFYTRAERRRLRERFDNTRNINHIWSWFRSLQNVLPYLTFTLITLAVLIFFQIKWVGGSNMVKAIENLTIAEENLKDKIARLYLVIETTDSEDEKFGELTVDLERRIDERDQKQSALAASRFLLEEWVSSYISDPQRPLEPGFFASDETVEKWRQEKVEWDLAREQKQESKNDLVFQQAQGVLQYMAGYFLPLLYGLLGSFTYVLRALSREISGISFSRGSHIQFMLRLLLGMLAGISVGWFLRPETEVGIVDISPFALAFLAGYSVELVFTAMDKIVNAFSGSGSANNPN